MSSETSFYSYKQRCYSNNLKDFSCAVLISSYRCNKSFGIVWDLKKKKKYIKFKFKNTCADQLSGKQKKKSKKKQFNWYINPK